jgi:hypothetical protein
MMFCDDERRCLVQLSLYNDEELLLRRLAAAEGVAPATLALDDNCREPWLAEGSFMHLDQAG